MEGCVSSGPQAAGQAVRGRGFVKTNSQLRYFILCGLSHFHTVQIIGGDFEGEGVQIRQNA